MTIFGELSLEYNTGVGVGFCTKKSKRLKLLGCSPVQSKKPFSQNSTLAKAFIQNTQTETETEH